MRHLRVRFAEALPKLVPFLHDGALVGYLLVGLLFAAALGWLAYAVWLGERKVLWTSTIRRVCEIIALAAVNSAVYALAYDASREKPLALAALQLAKDVPGLLLVGLLVAETAGKNVTVSFRASVLLRLLRSCPRVFEVCVVGAAIVAVADGVQQSLEADQALAGVTYRALVFSPIVAYSLLLFQLIGGDARSCAHLDASLARRYRLFSLGSLTWALLALDHLARPSLLHALDRPPGSALHVALNAAMGVLWALMASFWVYG
jgi:hypothetical protein